MLCTTAWLLVVTAANPCFLKSQPNATARRAGVLDASVAGPAHVLMPFLACLVVVAGPSSLGSIAIIRMSGSGAMDVLRRVFRPAGAAAGGNGVQQRAPWEPKSHRVYYGTAVDGSGANVDEVRCCVRHAGRCCANGQQRHT